MFSGLSPSDRKMALLAFEKAPFSAIFCRRSPVGARVWTRYSGCARQLRPPGPRFAHQLASATIFSLSTQMSSNQVNVAPETADGAIVAGQRPKSCLAKEIGNGALRKSAKSAKRHHFVAAVSRGRGDAGDGVRRPAADHPTGAGPAPGCPAGLRLNNSSGEFSPSRLC